MGDTGKRPGLVGEADASKKPSSATRIVSIPIGKIDFDDTQYYFRVTSNLHDIKEDIRKNGQQFPVVLRTRHSGGPYQIVSGFRRCNSLREIGAQFVAAIIRDDLTDDDAYYLSFIENERRKNLTGMDKANAIAKLAAQGKSPAEIQAIYGIGERHFYRLKKATELPREIRDAILDGFIQMTHGAVLAETYETVKTEMDLDEWIDWVVENKASVSQLRQALRERYRATKKDIFINIKAGGFRLSTLKFSPKKIDLHTARTMKENMLQALAIIDAWMNNQSE